MTFRLKGSAGLVSAVSAIALCLTFTAASAAKIGPMPWTVQKGPSRYLIQYSQGKGQALKDTIAAAGGKVAFDYSSLINGLAADLSDDALNVVRGSGFATHIEKDRLRTLNDNSTAFPDGAIPDVAPSAVPAGFPGGSFPEFVPWGRDRVQADVVWSTGPNTGPADNGIATPEVGSGKVTGQGVVVGVIDTGIDYNHEDLKDNILDLRGDGKIRDFIDGDADPQDAALIGHGTSTASVIASVDNTVGLIGVAPGAKISPYRVCGIGGCPISAIVAAVAQAVEDGVDVINMSFGGPNSSGIEASAMQEANRRGVVLVASAGNEASQVVHFPAGYDTVLAVGATDINDNAASFTNTGGWVDVTGPGVNNPVATCDGCVTDSKLDETSPNAQSFSTHTMDGSAVASAENINNVSAEIVNAGRLCFFTAGDPLPTNLAGHIALIQRGACSFAEKVFVAEALGAKGTVIYNNIPGNFFGTLGAFQAAGPSVSISDTDGATLVAEIGNGTTTANLDVFRSHILYEFNSGTSFSGPHVAGVAALVKSVNPTLSPIEVRKIIEMTAEPIGPTVIFGNGMVRADRAVQAAQ